MEKDLPIQSQELNDQDVTIPDGFVSTANVDGGESKTSTWRKIRDKEQERLKAA